MNPVLSRIYSDQTGLFVPFFGGSAICGQLSKNGQRLANNPVYRVYSDWVQQSGLVNPVQSL